MQCKNCGIEMKFYTSNTTTSVGCSHQFEVSTAVREAMLKSDQELRSMNELVAEMKYLVKEMKHGV